MTLLNETSALSNLVGILRLGAGREQGSPKGFVLRELLSCRVSADINWGTQAQ